MQEPGKMGRATGGRRSAGGWGPRPEAPWVMSPSLTTLRGGHTAGGRAGDVPTSGTRSPRDGPPSVREVGGDEAEHRTQEGSSGRVCTKRARGQPSPVCRWGCARTHPTEPSTWPAPGVGAAGCRPGSLARGPSPGRRAKTPPRLEAGAARASGETPAEAGGWG